MMGQTCLDLFYSFTFDDVKEVVSTIGQSRHHVLGHNIHSPFSSCILIAICLCLSLLPKQTWDTCKSVSIER